MNSPDTLSGGKRAGATRAKRTAATGADATRASQHPDSAAQAVKQTPARAGKTTRQPISAEERRKMVEVCAYFLAQERGFSPGSDQQDWLEAEARIDQILTPSARKSPRRSSATQ